MENCVHKSPVLDIPIEIGTYPLKNGASQTKTNALNDAIASKPQSEEKTNPSNCFVPSAPSMPSIYDQSDSGEAVSFPLDGNVTDRMMFTVRLNTLMLTYL